MTKSTRKRLKRRQIERAEEQAHLVDIKTKNLLTFYSVVSHMLETRDGMKVEIDSADDLHKMFQKFDARLKHNANKTIASYGEGFIRLAVSRENALSMSHPMTIEQMIELIELNMPQTDEDEQTE